MTADAVGGVWTYCLQLCQALPSVHFLIAGTGPEPTPEQWSEAQGQPNVEVVWNPTKLEWMEDPWEDLEHAGDWLLELERCHAPDLIHLNGYVHGSLPWRAPVLVAGHSCVLSWWDAVRKEAAPPEWDEYGRAVAAGLAAADLVVAPSRSMRENLLRHYGPLDCTVVCNGLKMQAGDSLKFPQVLASGRLWDHAKNISTLVMAAGGLPWPVIIAGSGGELPPVENVQFTGQLSRREMMRQFRDAAIYAAPSRYEPFGLGVLEAAAHGCALVLADIPTFRELWDGAALFVPADDASAWHRALLEMATDHQFRSTLASRAAKRAAEYSSEKMAVRYFDLYQQLLLTRKLAAVS